jgi:hypothetical protein
LAGDIEDVNKWLVLPQGNNNAVANGYLGRYKGPITKYALWVVAKRF